MKLILARLMRLGGLLRVGPVLIPLICFASLSAAQPIRQVLTSAGRGIHLNEWRLTHRDLDPSGPLPWSVHKYTLHGGRQEGVDLVVIDNGKLSFSVIPTRGMGLFEVEMGDIRLGWDSPVKEVVHPKFINLHSRGGLGWLEGFNEWLVRCGLEFAGHPGTDRFVNNVGDEAEMELTLHGKIANIPASEVEIVVDESRIVIRGRVDERMFYGPKLELWTEISTEIGADWLRIEDIVTNRGGREQEFQIIYHANYGLPLLEDGSRFIGPVKRLTPFNAHAAQSLDRYDRYDPPTRGFIEQVYCIVPYADASGRTRVMLRNSKADRAVSMSFSVEQMPYFTLWKNTVALEEGYVTGLEPGTGFPYNRRIERRFGRVPVLMPGHSRRFRVDVQIHVGEAGVQSVVEGIEGIQAGRATRIDRNPMIETP